MIASPDGALSPTSDASEDLPAWDLSDLYPARAEDEAEGGFAGRAAALADLAVAAAEAGRFAEAYAGRIADALPDPAEGLHAWEGVASRNPGAWKRWLAGALRSSTRVAQLAADGREARSVGPSADEESPRE